MKWLTDRLDYLHLSQAALARELGVAPSRITDWKNGEWRLPLAKAHDLARILKMQQQDVIDLITERATAGLTTPVTRTKKSPTGHDLKLYLATDGGGNGSMSLSSEPTALIERPPGLVGVADAFAVTVTSDNMSPAFEVGDEAFIDPSSVVQPNHNCLMIAADGLIPPPITYLLRMVRSTATTWYLKQFNPPKNIELSKKLWPRALRVRGHWSR